MGGIIRGFLGGAARGASVAGEILLRDKLAREREEAGFLRDSELRKDLQTERLEHTETMQKTGFEHDESLQEAGFEHDETTQKAGFKHDESMQDKEQEFITGERISEQQWKSVENELDRWSDEEIADIKTGSSKPTSAMKNARDLMAQGYPQDIANAIAHGGFVKHTDIEGNEVVVMPQKGGGMVEVGKIVTDNRGKTRWVPNVPGQSAADVEPTTDDIAKARREYEEKASLWKTDKSQFGMSESQWVKKRAKEIAAGKESKGGGKATGGDKGGIVQSTMGAPGNAKSSKAPYREGQELVGPDGKRYVVKDGKPVLKENQ